MSRHLRDLISLLERATYTDNYGEPGSDFEGCNICCRESGAGVLYRPGWHASSCPVPRLQNKYARQLYGKRQS